MSIIQLSELQPVKTEFKELNNHQCTDIVGGRKGGGNRSIRNNVNVNTNVTNNIFNQLNIAVTNNVVVVVNSPKSQITVNTTTNQNNGIG
jgi:hypothetical protein